MFDSGPAGVGSTEPDLEPTPFTHTRSESLRRAYVFCAYLTRLPCVREPLLEGVFT